jgi:hypothetical protein
MANVDASITFLITVLKNVSHVIELVKHAVVRMMLIVYHVKQTISELNKMEIAYV